MNEHSLKVTGLGLVAIAIACCLQSLASAAEAKEIRVGIIGLDTSHAIAFTKLLNGENPPEELANCRVVAAYPKGSPDIESSVSRVPGYTAEVEKMGVKIVGSIDELLTQVDAVLLETNDGRPHLEQALPVLRAKKRLFVDKPMAGSLADVIAIFDAAKASGTPVFSSSSLRYGKGVQAVRDGSIGEVLGCDTYSPCSLEATHPDFFWYGIHGVEPLFAVMGTGCESVSRVAAPDSDVAVGLWKGGRIGTFRGLRAGKLSYGGTAFGSDNIAPLGDYDGYEPLVVEIVKFFRGGEPPVTAEETIEIFAFMTAADESKRQGGKPVMIQPLLEQARQEAQERLGVSRDAQSSERSAER
ncbi:MAG: Gfo/Idh/MocA family oxidoreductase [Pirellulales bacterium]